MNPDHSNCPFPKPKDFAHLRQTRFYERDGSLEMWKWVPDEGWHLHVAKTDAEWKADLERHVTGDPVPLTPEEERHVEELADRMGWK